MSTLEFPQSRCHVGVARGDITPPVGIYHRMWGAATHDRSSGVHRPLTATVLRLSGVDSDPSDARFLVALDHCLLWPAEMQSFRTDVANHAQIDPDQLTVLFSHTHAAGLMDRDRDQMPGGEMIADYLDQMATTVGQLAGQAQHSQLANIAYGCGRCDLAANRDFFDVERQQTVCGFNPAGATDDAVLVGRITASDGRCLATVVNYACHPTTLAWDNQQISPDYVGAMREVVESVTDAPCFFIQGASGDLGPRQGYVGDTAVADRNGRQLGYVVLSVLESLPPQATRYVYQGAVPSGATIGVWDYEPVTAERLDRLAAWQSQQASVSLAVRSDLPSRVDLKADFDRWQQQYDRAVTAQRDDQRATAHAMLERTRRAMTRVEPFGQPTYLYIIDLLKIGDAIWVFLDGEHYNQLQRQLRRQFPHTTLIIGTLAGGSRVWYLPDAASYGRGLYQEEASVLSQGALEKVTDCAARAIEKLLD